MKLKTACLLALALTLCRPLAVGAEEPASLAYGMVILPLDFYLDHRKELDLSDDQAHEMQRILEGMREPGEHLAAEMRERTAGLHEAVGANPVNPDQAMERFRAILEVENEMKSLQFRVRMELRQVLRPEQYDKVRAFAAKGSAATQEQARGELREKLEAVREQIQRQSGGKVPPEVIEQLERIVEMARKGHRAEAEEHLDNLMRHFGAAKKPGKEGEAEIHAQLEKLEATLKNATEPAQREEIERQIRRLRGGHGGEKGHAEGADNLEKQMHRIADRAEHTDNPELREKLQAALTKLREAVASNHPEVVGKILEAVEPLLQGANP